MGRTPPSILDNQLNEVMQAVLTYVSWGLVIVMLVIDWRLGKKEHTPFYLFACLAACVAAFAEPLYDVAFDLWFYDVNSQSTSASAPRSSSPCTSTNQRRRASSSPAPR